MGLVEPSGTLGQIPAHHHALGEEAKAFIRGQVGVVREADDAADEWVTTGIKDMVVSAHFAIRQERHAAVWSLGLALELFWKGRAFRSVG